MNGHGNLNVCTQVSVYLLLCRGPAHELVSSFPWLTAFARDSADNSWLLARSSTSCALRGATEGNLQLCPYAWNRISPRRVDLWKTSAESAKHRMRHFRGRSLVESSSFIGLLLSSAGFNVLQNFGKLIYFSLTNNERGWLYNFYWSMKCKVRTK